MDGPPNTDVRNVPGVDAILSHHRKNQVRLDAKKKTQKETSVTAILTQAGTIWTL